MSEESVLLLGCVSFALGHRSVCVACRCPVLSNLIYMPALLSYLQYVRLFSLLADNWCFLINIKLCSLPAAFDVSL